MDPEAHPSYSHLYDVKNAEAFPFNQGTVSCAHQEKTTFLALSIKRNSLAMRTPLLEKVAASLSSLFAKPAMTELINAADKSGKAKMDLVDFKKTLMPLICTIGQDDLLTRPTIGLNLSAKYMGDSLKRFLSHVELVLPSESQWETLNLLRIHAGSPERSAAGIDKIAEY